MIKAYLFLANPIVAAGVAQALGNVAGVINAFGMVFMFAGLLAAAYTAFSERHVGSIKLSLIVAAVGGMAWIIAQAMFQAGGQQTNIQLAPIN